MGGMSSRMTCDDVVKCMKEHEEKKPSTLETVQNTLGMRSEPKPQAPALTPGQGTGPGTGPNTAVGGGYKKSKKSKKRKQKRSNKKQKKKSNKKNKKNKRKSGQKRK